MCLRLHPADRGQQAWTKNRLAVDFRSIRIVEITCRRFVKPEAIFGHKDRGVWQFDMLDRFEFAGRSQLQTLDLGVLDFVVDRFVDTLGRQRLTQFAIVPFCPPRLAFFRRFACCFGGLTMSLEGDSDEFDEFFNALASCSSRSVMRSACCSSCAVCLATSSRNSAMIRSLLSMSGPYQIR